MPDRQALADWVEQTLKSDVNQAMGFHSWVLPARKCVCMTVPKIACSRIKLTLHLLQGNLALDHLGNVHSKGIHLGSFGRDEIVEMLSSPDWFRFCFVRNPYMRLLSAYKTQVGNSWNQETRWLKDDIKKGLDLPVATAGREGLVPFADVVRYLHREHTAAKPAGGVHHDGHFNIQNRILAPHLIPYDFVGRFESFQADFSQVLKRLVAPPEILATVSEVKNATYMLHPAIAYDSALARMTCEIYESDFQSFGYDRDSWIYEV